MWTKRGTRASAAAARTARVPSTWTLWKVAAPRSTMIPTRWITASAPRASRSSAPRSPRWPATSSTPEPGRNPARPGSRASARTRCPRLASVAAMCRPTKPVAPVIEMTTGERGGSLVQEHERLAPCHDRGQPRVDLGVDDRAREVGHALHGLLRRHFLLVRPGRAERVEELCGHDHAGAERDRLAAQAVGVARAVPALVVAAHRAAAVGMARQ